MRIGAPGVLLAALLGLAALACGGEDKEPTSISVSLNEWSIETSAEVVEPGEMIFEVTNMGAEQHELVIIKSDLPPDSLDLAGEQVDESRVNIVTRIEALTAGASQTLEVELTAGKYLLICNLLDQATDEGHYEKGMAVSLLAETR